MDNVSRATQAKWTTLLASLTDMESVLVAFSGGVDSTLLLEAAVSTLGKNVLAVTATSHTLPQSEEKEAIRLAARTGVEHLLLPVDELSCAEFARNDADRCYHCKKLRYQALIDLARARGVAWVVDGENADDAGDYRPGTKAAREMGVRSPLAEVGLSKAEIRRLAAALGLDIARKPAYACLASRVPYGTPITAEGLARVEQAEAFLHDLGLTQFRVRMHGDTARIETRPADIAKLARRDTRVRVVARFKDLGFKYVSLDLEGYRMGSLNAALAKPKVDEDEDQ